MLRLTAAGVGVGAAAVALDASRQVVSESHSWKSAANQYVLHRVMALMGAFCRLLLKSATKNAPEEQRKFVRELLAANANTVYGQEHRFAELKDLDGFREQHPLTRSAHYQSFIERIANGEQNVLTKDPVTRLGMTSGTSGNVNVLPVVAAQRNIFFFQGITTVFDVIARQFPGFNSSMQRTLKIFFTPIPRSAPCGLPMGPNSSAPGDSKGLLQLYTTPPAAYDIMSEPEALYVYVLFALKDRNLGCIESNFISAVYNMYKVLSLAALLLHSFTR